MPTLATLHTSLAATGLAVVLLSTAGAVAETATQPIEALSIEAPLLDDDRLGPGRDLPGSIRLFSRFELWAARAGDDATVTRPGLRLRAERGWGERLDLVVELRASRTADDTATGNAHDLRLGETFLAWRPHRALELRFGRQAFRDERGWSYDQDLDALRVSWTRAATRVELSASTTLAAGSERDESATNFIGSIERQRARGKLTGWAVYRSIGNREDAPLHVGFRSRGNFIPDTKSWLEVAWLTGERGGQRIRAYGLDAGLTWVPRFARELNLSLGYALGSGGAPRPGREDRTFRQTGFQDNTGRLGGVTPFRYYGEVLDPELANIAIVTAGIGGRLGRGRSLDLLWHSYHQEQALPVVIGTRIDGFANGLDRDLGQGIDLVFGGRLGAGWDLEAVLGRFEPGAAFDGVPRDAGAPPAERSAIEEDDDAAVRVGIHAPTTLFKLQARYRF